MTTNLKENSIKKERAGRWTKAQCSVFQELLQRHGKNWKKIQEHMKGRTLSQVRSHAQKFFEKVGPKKVQSYERKAKLIEAYSTLQKQNLLQSSFQQENEYISSKGNILLNSEKIQEQNSFAIDEQTIIADSPQINENKQSEFIKEQAVQTTILKVEAPTQNSLHYPFLNGDMSFFMYMMNAFHPAFSMNSLF